MLQMHQALHERRMTMKVLSRSLAAALIVGLSFAVTAQAPSFAGGTASGACPGTAIVTAERPAGAVNLGQRNSSGYSPWSSQFRMTLDSQSRFQFTCISTQGPSSFLNFSSYPVRVRCADRSNLLRARLVPGRVEFQCIARDHRR
jgi:hypothetical protein